MIVLQHIAGIFLLMGAILAFGGGSVLSGAFLLVSGLLCMPFVRQGLHRQGIHFNTLTKYAMVVGGLVLGLLAKPGNRPEGPATAEPLATQTDAPAAELPLSYAATSRHYARRKLVKKPHSLRGYHTRRPGPVRKSSASSHRDRASRPSAGHRYAATGRAYITGPRGGCYYINANGRKVYVDHSYCYP